MYLFLRMIGKMGKYLFRDLNIEVKDLIRGFQFHASLVIFGEKPNENNTDNKNNNNKQEHTHTNDIIYKKKHTTIL